MRKLILILGMHRSGTSLVAQLVQSMGVYLGKKSELLGVEPSNLDGHFENREIVSANNDILHLCNKEWYSLEAAGPDYENPQIVEAMEKIEAVIRRLFEESDLVAIKDPRISVLLPVWERILSRLKVEVNYIWVFRNPLEVMESLRKRDGYSSKHALLLWINYNLSILKFLQEKDFLLIHYKDILENSCAVESLNQLFSRKFDSNLKGRWSQIIKRGYCHADFSYQDVRDRECALLTNLYGALLRKQEIDINISEWENRYMIAIAKEEIRYMDYKTMENIKYLEEKEIIIYGAGKYGQQTAEMLQQLGFSKYNFCDKDVHKHGMKIMNGKVLSITEIENKKNLLIIIAIENEIIKKEVEQTLAYIDEVQFLSFLH